MKSTHPGQVLGALRYGWVAVVLALAAATLPTAAASAAPVEAQHAAPELAQVTVGENIPVAPVEPLTEENAPGRVSGGIGVNPDDPDHIVTFTWDMHAEPGQTCQHHVSFDGGETWTSGTFPVPAGFNTEGEGNRGYCSNERGGGRSSTHGEMEFGSDDTVYTSFVAIKEGRLGNSLLVARSDDGGQSFSAPVEVIEGGTTTPVATDPNLFWGRVAVDPGAGVGGADRVYAQGRGSIVSNTGDVLPNNIAVVVSDDGGQTWGDPVAVNRVGEPTPAHPDFGGSLASQIVIGPDGDAFTAWRTFPGNEGEIRIGRTTDGGETWTVDKVVDVRAHITADGAAQSTNGYPRLAVDDSSGALYLVYHQDPPLPMAAAAGIVGPADHWFDPHAAVYLVKSTDDGATWSDQVKVNDEPHAEDGNVYHETRIPTVAVAPSGRVDVVWMDRRHWTEGRGTTEDGSQDRPAWRFDDHCTDSHAACTDARISDIYHSFSTDGGETFSTDVRVTDYSSNDDTGWEWNIGPFWHHGMDLDHAGDDLVAAWGDSRRAQALPTVGWTNTEVTTVCPPDCAVAAGVGGPENHDLFIAEVRHDTAPAASPRVQTVPADDPADLSVAMSQIGYPGGEQGRLTGNRITSPFSHAVVVNEGDWASALVGSVLARRYMGPVLATPASALPSSVSDEIDRMDLDTDEQADPENPDIGDPTQVPCSFAAGVCINEELVHRALGGAFILGGTEDVGAGIQSDLEGRDIDVTRFEQNPAQMAAAVALHLDDRLDAEIAAPTPPPAFDAVVVVNPEDPDSASVSALAANRRLPVLFVNSDSIPAATAGAIADLDIDHTIVVGDTEAVSDAVLADLPGAERLSGEDAFATSADVVEESHRRGLPTNVVYAVGDDPMHAALAGSPVARAGGLLVQAPDADPDAAMDPVEAAGLREHVDKLVRFGDPIITEACPAGEVPATPFTDIAGNTHEDTIACIFWYGVTQGTTATTYGPANRVRRDQMASFIARMMEASGVTLPAPSDQGFGDIDGNVHEDRINQLAAIGVVLGTTATTYAPSQEVRRDQMASFLVRAYEEINDAELTREASPFTDVAGNTHLANIEKAATAGFTLGTTATTYAPSAQVRRDQMGSFLARVLERGMDDGHVLLPGAG